MTILKKGDCQSSAKTSSTVYICDSCGYTTMSKDCKDCPQCHSTMSKVTSGAEETRSDATPDTV